MAGEGWPEGRVAASDSAGQPGVRQLVEKHYPIACRLAAGLCGGGSGATPIVDRVLERVPGVAVGWTSDLEAERWFLRFTVLVSREVGPGEDGDVGLSWLTPLPVQQREAVVLYHGLGLDLHRVAAAMDCSSSAVANHLVGATALLQGTGQMDQWTAALPGQLAAVMPPPAVISQQVAKAIARRCWRVWARRVGVVLLLVAVAAAGWAGWVLWRMLVI